MPNRLSRLLSRSSKEQEVEAESERNIPDESPPPEYQQQAPDYNAENVLHPPDVTAGFSNLSLDEQNSDTPQVSQCIAHLKVLECFYRLRQQVGAIDGLFGIENKVVVDRDLPDKERDALFAKLAEKKWAIYVSRAVDRFEAWAGAIFPVKKFVQHASLETLGKKGALIDHPSAINVLNFDDGSYRLPPVDVLMVWHAYMLNPRAYLEDCLRLRRMPMWHAGFPWKAVVERINSESFAYNADEAAQEAFTKMTGIQWGNLEPESGRQIKCPSCEADIKVPWTTCQDYVPRQDLNNVELEGAIDTMLSSGRGYCDRDFTSSCPKCQAVIDHDRLRAAKFCADINMLLTDDVPMGGTILGTKGIPFKFDNVSDPLCSYTCTFPNNMLKAGLGSEILKQPAKGGLNQSMEGIRQVIEIRIKDWSYVRKIPGTRGVRLQRHQRIGIRRMMSKYWENSSPFALDLMGAVIRQGSFIEKMHNIDWLHSPALPSTMKRLLVKYQRFVSIMADSTSMAVPTLDVDLAWHTHQLSPYSYMKYTVATTNQFIDHDDKVAEMKLNDAFAWTSKTYQKIYGEPYSECTCWYCEAVRESHTSTASRLFKSNNSQANEQLHSAEQDPSKSVHISAHNAVRPTDSSTYNKAAQYKADQLEKQYQRACERARKKGRPVPNRNDYYYSDAWGYPVYIPAYGPYLMFAAYSPLYYPVTPGCMALGAGAYGNCCSGTCGGGVAAGACGGGAGGACGGGGCAGGAAGGCGGGGGGGCGGGGGGGCGGGGGGGGCGGGGGGG